MFYPSEKYNVFRNFLTLNIVIVVQFQLFIKNHTKIFFIGDSFDVIMQFYLRVMSIV